MGCIFYFLLSALPLLRLVSLYEQLSPSLLLSLAREGGLRERAELFVERGARALLERRERGERGGSLSLAERSTY